MKHKSLALRSGKREVRTYVAASPLEVRTTADGHKQVSGYAIVFNSKSVDLGFTEICSPNMLDRTLKESPDILLLRDHKQELLLGRTTAGTLEFKTDSKGLAFTVTLPKTATGDDTAENVRLGNLTGCSFGFVTVNDSWTQTDDGQVIRTLLDIDLFEISITSFPAYESTSVNTRSCPTDLRSKLRKKDPIDQILDADDNDDSSDDDVDNGDQDTQNGDDDDYDEDRCSCRCERCAMTRCIDCYNRDCSDDNCRSASCPMQDDQRADTLRLRRHYESRLHNNVSQQPQVCD
jgi:uncharacterized protein